MVAMEQLETKMEKVICNDKRMKTLRRGVRKVVV